MARSRTQRRARFAGRWLILLVAASAQRCDWAAYAQAGAALPDAPQATVRRFEFGLELADTQLTLCGPAAKCVFPAPQFALSPGITLRINPHIAVDAAYSVFPSYDNTQDPSYGGHGTMLLAGLRAEAPATRFSFYGFERPGFMHWTGVDKANVLTSQGVVPIRTPATYFANELGGGVEYPLSSRIRIRAEAGDLLVDRGSRICTGCSSWTNNARASAGMYFGVGRAIVLAQPAGETQQHALWDRTNILLLGVSLLGQTADAITTQRFRSHGGIELDPWARPLVNRGWAGQVTISGLYTAAQVAVMYGLHKGGHHRIERIVPMGPALGGAISAYHNLQNR